MNASGSFGVIADGEVVSDLWLPGELRGLAVRLRRLDLKLVILLQSVGLGNAELERSVLMEETEEMSDVGDLGGFCGSNLIVFVERPFFLMRTAWHERCFP